MTIYLMNTTIVPSGANGLWKVSTTELDSVVDFIAGGFVSAIGHESTAELISILLGSTVPMNRITVKPHPGDALVCFKLKQRAPEGVILSKDQIEELGYEWCIMNYLQSS